MKPSHAIKKTLIGVCILCGCWIGAGSGETRGEPLPAIFNGRDLAGWTVPDDGCWTVEAGQLNVRSNAQKKGSILWTEKEFTNFVLELEFRPGAGTVDSGVFLRHEREQIQIGISGSLKRDMTASPYIAGKGYPVEATGVAELLRPADWNVLTVVAKGAAYDVWLNGRHVLSYTSPSAAERGAIGLQLHPGNEMEISFRNVRLAELE